MVKKSILLLTLVSAFLLAGCSIDQSEIPTETLPPNATATLEQPTPTTTFTPTALPTNTPIPDITVLRTYFEYDKDVPLDLVVEAEEKIGNAIVKTITYQSTDDHIVYAYLVTPSKSGTYPVIIYAHKGMGTKDQFLENEAINLAEMGVVTLLIDAIYNLPVYPGITTRESIIYYVIDARRGIDLLETLPQVDAERIGYVGHSQGATYGGILVGVEPRIKAFVLMAGLHNISSLFTGDSSNPLYAINDLDAINYIGHSEGAAFLFQYAESDEYISRSDALKYYNAATEPKEILWYDADHDTLEWKSREDRLMWLSEQLGFTYVE